MRKNKAKISLFKRWQKYTLFLAALSILLQIWLLQGRQPQSVDRVTPRPFIPGNEIGELRSRYKLQPNFQMGMIFPQWGKPAYSNQDANWHKGLHEIQDQTDAHWIAMTINFTQLSPSSTQVQTAQNTPTVQALAEGIHEARTMGYHVFIQPLITVQGLHSWAGYIQFTTEQLAQSWFDSYWQTFSPYIKVAAQAGAEELALGTEYEHLGIWTDQWNQLIMRVHSIFNGAITYDINWTSLTTPLSPWMHNRLLSYIGVSIYISLTSVPQRLQPKDIVRLWREKIGKVLDELSVKMGKPILISEIGYRNSPDALYRPESRQTLPGTDPEEQAAAYNAALQNVMSDPHITGIFFWAWSLPPYQPNGEPASQVIYYWYASLSA